MRHRWRRRRARQRAGEGTAARRPRHDLPGPWSRRTRIFVVAAVTVGFVAFYLAVARTAGGGAAAPVAFVLLAAGYFLGLRAGVVAGLLIMPLIWVMNPLVGVEGAGGLLRRASYVAVMVLLGAGGGWVGRLQGGAEAARAEAVHVAGRLEQAQEITRLGYWALFAGGRIEWSRPLWEAFGFTEEPEDVEEAFARIHPADEPRVRAHIESLWQRGGHVEGEHRVLQPDGTLRWIAYTGDAERGTDGSIGRVFGTGQDITERKRAQAAAQRFRDLLDRLEDVYWIGDPANNRFVFSGAAQTVFGRPAEELSVDPGTLQEAVHPDDLEKTQAAIGEAVAGRPAMVEFRAVRPDGSIRRVRSRAWPIAEDEQYTAYGIMSDVTAEREVVELRELDRVKALFMSAAAHELNTPLTPLKLQAAILARRLPGEKAVAVMQRNVARLEALVRDLLDASRIQAGRLKYDIHDAVDLTTLLEDVATGAAPQAERDGKTWEADIPEGLTLRADPGRLTQVFTNLVNNAFKFTPEGGKVALRARDEGEVVRVEVSDTGLGMTAEQIGALFEPFQQFHRSHTGDHRGTGLGLFISRGIVDRHQGRIEVTSSGPGRGTTLTVTLPVHSTAESTSPTAADDEE